MARGTENKKDRQDDNGGEFLSPAEVILAWGDAFKDLASHPKIKFRDDSVVVELSQEVHTTDEGPSKWITLREPTVQSLKSLDRAKGDIERAAILLEVCGNVTGKDVSSLKGRDFILLQKIVAAFLSDGQ